MTLKGWRLQFVIAGFLVTLVALFGGYFLYRQYSLYAPLQQTLRAEPGVKQFELTATPKGYRLQVSLGQVDNVQASYDRIAAQAQRVLGSGRPLEIVLLDSRSPALQAVWEQSQFAIYEAAALGNYTSMAGQVAGFARQAGLTRYGLHLDDERIYLQLHQGESYLYAVVPRQQPEQRTAGGKEAKAGA